MTHSMTEVQKRQARYREIRAHLEGNAQALAPSHLKALLAPFGIYEQRNERFMMRVRVTGGHLPVPLALQWADLMEKHGIPYAHLSSRQTLQLHDVEPAQVCDILQDFEALGHPFQGGGGNTYRNIRVSPTSGAAVNQAFDVMPYALQLNEILQGHEPAFTLPRKLKIGYFACPDEAFQAAQQDLGFVANLRNGEGGFQVYAGGGLGRESGLGMLLFDWLPAGQHVRCALALTTLFHEHGDRQNRHRARLRFLLANLGEDAFKTLFMSYFERWAMVEEKPHTALMWKDHQGESFHAGTPEVDYPLWQRHAVTPTRFAGYHSVRLYVRYGNLTVGQLRRLADWADRFGPGYLRLTPTQDLMLTPVSEAALPSLYANLRHDLPELDLALTSFKGHICTCIGADVCKIGILAAPELGDAIAKVADQLLPADTSSKLAKLAFLTQELRVSGCPNGCSGHAAARMGIQGQKQHVDDRWESVGLVFAGASDRSGAFKLSGLVQDISPLPMEVLGNRVDALIDRVLFF